MGTVLEARIWNRREALQARFPTLAFHYFHNVSTDTYTIRVMPADPNDDGLLSVRRGKVGAQYHEEAIDPANFPSDGFIARCCLIA